MNCSGLVPLHGDLLHGGLVSSFSCCLALDPSSSCPCPTFRAIAKSRVFFFKGQDMLPTLHTSANHTELKIMTLDVLWINSFVIDQKELDIDMTKSINSGDRG
ncbi:hypothetical protein STEG23_018069 [Scotinomys teguina]